MSRSRIDITGQTFGKLTALCPSNRTGPNGQLYWWFRCACGELHEACKHAVRYGVIKSCGCLWLQAVRDSHYKHGMAKTSLWYVWCAMKQRCHNKRHKDYRYYGARGIVVCSRWRDSFAAFIGDMGEPPTGMTIDRINNDGNYEPGNCRWATRSQQMRNSRRWAKRSA